MDYFGKYKKSRKAVELIIIGDGLSNILGASYPLPEWLCYFQLLIQKHFYNFSKGISIIKNKLYIFNL